VPSAEKGELRREPDALDGARVLALALVATAAIGSLGGAGLSNDLRSALLQASFFLVPIAYARASKLAPLRDAGFARPRLLDVFLTLAASMASLWLLKGLLDLQNELFSAFGTKELAEEEARKIERTLDRARRQGGLPLLSLFAVVPPLCEETLFRGLMLRGFERGFGTARALLYTSLLFAGMHGTSAQLLLMTFLGLYFGALAALGGSLWLAILAHAINNGAVLALQVVWGAEVQDFRASPLVLALSALVLAGVLAYFGLRRRAGALRDQVLGAPGA